MDTPSPGPTPAPRPALFWRILRGLRVTLITLFVLWHLFFLLFRNPFDLREWKSDFLEYMNEQEWWKAPITEVSWPRTPEKDATPDEIEWAKNRKIKVSPYWVFTTLDDVTSRYGNFFGIDQGWSMFTPPLARKAPFLGAELTFTDGTTAMLYSPNEPDMDQRRGLSSGYIRLGGWRQRKLEDYMLTRDSVASKDDKQVYQAYILWCIRRWRDANPGDRREVKFVTVVWRSMKFPEPGKDPSRFEPVTSDPIGIFNPDGTLRQP
jgi:hypothetical protein